MPDDNTPEPLPESAYPPPSSAYPTGDNFPPATPPAREYESPRQEQPNPYGAAVPPSDPYHPGPPSQTPPIGGYPSQQPWPPPPVGSYPPSASPQYSPVNATLILILGILGVTICGICAPIAWILGQQAMTTLNQYGDPLNQRGMVNGGRICGIIGTILIAIGLVFYAIAIAFGFFGALTHPSS